MGFPIDNIFNPEVKCIEMILIQKIKELSCLSILQYQLFSYRISKLGKLNKTIHLGRGTVLSM